jgi:integrase/recombinase XerC
MYASLIQSFLDYLKFEKRFSRHTIISYETDLVSFFTYLEEDYGQIELRSISHVYIRSWLASLKDSGLKAKSINRKISSLRSFFKYQLRMGQIEETPMFKVVAPKNEKRLPQFVPGKDIDTLFNYFEFGDTWKGKTDRLIFLLFYQTGMRLSELINLREVDINSSGRSVKVLGKGNKERVIPVNPELLAAMDAYCKEKQGLGLTAETLLVTEKGKKLSPRSVYDRVRGALEAVTTIEKKSPHILRHSFATHLTNAGADLNAVKELLGHSSLAATQVYTHNTIDKLKNIYANAHPKA